MQQEGDPMDGTTAEQMDVDGLDESPMDAQEEVEAEAEETLPEVEAEAEETLPEVEAEAPKVYFEEQSPLSIQEEAAKLKVSVVSLEEGSLRVRERAAVLPDHGLIRLLIRLLIRCLLPSRGGLGGRRNAQRRWL